ncbi:Adaptin Ear-Binding Coat-Associated Protein 1 [Manis pentadactyla]|nr:Adaptin Ear-Binding Coat-Associated Protein 1 [Manis pentadactyla]
MGQPAGAGEGAAGAVLGRKERAPAAAGCVDWTGRDRLQTRGATGFLALKARLEPKRVLQTPGVPMV